MGGDVPTIEDMLSVGLNERGADVDAKNHAGETPLFKLVVGQLYPKKKEAMLLLIASGADVNARSADSKAARTSPSPPPARSAGCPRS